LGIQKGIQRAYALRRLPTPKQVLKRGQPWAPYRTIASWYLWRLLDIPAE
jgi:DNA-3-methyladenine glycosylase II